MQRANKNEPLMGVILAAGRGVRAYPTTKYIPKVLIEISGKTLLERNIEILRDQLGIRDVIIVIGYLGHKITKYLSYKDLGVRVSFVVQPEQNGIGNALLAVEKHVRGRRFVVILGDELYIGSNHSKLLDFYDNDASATLTFRHENNKSKISRNFIGNIENGTVCSLIEKPETPDTKLMGLGTYLLTNKVFDYIRSTPPSKLRGEVEITDVLSNMAQNEKVVACTLDGEYINMTSTDDINMANYILRDKHFDKYQVSVVIPAYNEAQTIGHVIEDFKNHPGVDEVLVVDNNSKDQTREVALNAGARVVSEKRQGYGCALRKGMDEAEGDIMILTEADGSFRSKDIPKLLEYLKECDMVIGTRTTQQMIEQGANMNTLLRWGNVFFGKLIQMLWWSHKLRFTDVGCTYRAIWKQSYQKIRQVLKGNGPEFSPAMMISVLLAKQRIVEVPVSYYKRIGGESKYSKNLFWVAKTALKMLRIILMYRFRLSVPS